MKEKYNWFFEVVETKKIPKFMLSNFEREFLVKYVSENFFNRELNIKNPERFSDKIVWYEMYYNNKELKNIICKVAFKDFVKERIGEGYTARLYGAWDNVEDISWDYLPKSFVLKSSCSSFGKNILFIDDKDSVSFEEIKKKVKPWLDCRNTAMNSYGQAYYYVTPKIMAEEYVGEIKNQPVDYKIFCFDGVPTYCYSAFEHFDNGVAQSSKIAFYDLEWNVLPVRYKKSQCIPVEKPKHFEEMKEIAAKLSKGIPFVRVDFYDTDDRLLLGEMTLYSGGLTNKFTPDAFDFEMGRHFVLPKKKKQHRKLRLDLVKNFMK